MASLQTTAAPALAPATRLIGEDGPWVADLHGSDDSGECQSSVGFDSHPCEGTPHWHVELEVAALAAANPRWEGKLCDACLAGVGNGCARQCSGCFRPPDRHRHLNQPGSLPESPQSDTACAVGLTRRRYGRIPPDALCRRPLRWRDSGSCRCPSSPGTESGSSANWVHVALRAD